MGRQAACALRDGGRDSYVRLFQAAERVRDGARAAREHGDSPLKDYADLLISFTPTFKAVGVRSIKENEKYAANGFTKVRLLRPGLEARVWVKLESSLSLA